MDLSTLIEIYEGQAESQFLRFVLYGMPGSGKTTLLGTFPKPFFIDYDKGMSVLGSDSTIPKHIPRIKMSLDTPNAFEIVVQTIQEATRKTGIFGEGGKAFGCESFCIDSYTNMAECFIRAAMRESNKDPIKGKPGFDEWGRVKQQCVYIASLLRDLSAVMHVGITAWSTEKENELTKVIRGSPDIAGSYKDRIGGDMDETYYMEAKRNTEGKLEIILHAAKWQGIYEAKTRVLDKLDFVNPTFATLAESMARKRAQKK